jgi:hypothetical protein
MGQRLRLGHQAEFAAGLGLRACRGEPLCSSSSGCKRCISSCTQNALCRITSARGPLTGEDVINGRATASPGGRHPHDGRCQRITSGGNREPLRLD